MPRTLTDYEKSQIQALERTAPVLPVVPDAAERRSFDHVRHGTVDLLAALNTATGKVIGEAVRAAPGGGNGAASNAACSARSTT
ncbi:hypothetical protein [Streptomyces sp. NPDC001508]|uniref:hypothetical protein n=1 Tax=Streptomyces sp. NPDC001508 TaxID=3154656 RepID=UPI00332C2839